MSGAARIPIAALAAAVLASCAQPQQWHKPGVTTEQWHRDKAACQIRARAKADQRLREKGSEVASPVYGGGNTLERSMAQYDASRHQRTLFEDCLKGRGYSKTKPAPETKT